MIRIHCVFVHRQTLVVDKFIRVPRNRHFILGVRILMMRGKYSGCGARGGSIRDRLVPMSINQSKSLSCMCRERMSILSFCDCVNYHFNIMSSLALSLRSAAPLSTPKCMLRGRRLFGKNAQFQTRYNIGAIELLVRELVPGSRY